MLQKIDNYIVKNNEYRKNSKFEKLKHQKWFMIFASLFVIQQTIVHCIDKCDHHKYFFCAMYALIAALLIFFHARHIFMKQKIDGFEFKISVVEALLYIYFGIARLIEKWHEWSILKLLFFLFLTIFMATMFLFISRIHKLKHEGLI